MEHRGLSARAKLLLYSANFVEGALIAPGTTGTAQSFAPSGAAERVATGFLRSNPLSIVSAFLTLER
jgi:hypothetical protein